ncbi:M1 family aminopeptidase [Muricauda sp. 334s03]|uniref:M1 family aminopeptidase n=1 Tax=Flagellimonas yonaguniensis TaxID=3031325 RepID=A0ABT5XYX3_9FLAO|nr:M1 family aminopeptidase [[Muricauda] yonaguniensis]MDF0716392.1 M1 family aminopeptidase [[Muricauda] yonaguniensis]
MKTIILNDIQTIVKQKATYAALLVFVGIGFLTGFKFNISVGDELAGNASYSVGFMIGLLSLAIILIATVLAFSLLFKEQDANYGLIVFSTPIKKKVFALARFCSFYLVTLLGFFTLIIGYMVGLHLSKNAQMNPGFNLWHFTYPFLIFGAINTLVVCCILFFIAQAFKNKLLVAISGLLLYVFYMIALMFSNAPFMAQAMPQSLMVQRISALVDVFGLSGYFFEAKDLNVFQRNNQVVPLTNLLLINRLIFTLFSLGVVYLGVRSFSFLPRFKGKSQKKSSNLQQNTRLLPFFTTATTFNRKSKWQATFSVIKVDSIYIFKSIAFVAISILLLFYVGVEMFDDINKGVRMPQLYASSGLLAQTINNTFYALGGLILVYFVNDIFWRSKASGFSIIENTTYHVAEKRTGHIGSIFLLILSLTAIMLIEAIVFQLVFRFPIFDWEAYVGVFIFNTLPLLLFALFLLFINTISKNKAIALGISILSFLLFATPISKSIIDNSLFRFFSGYRGTYSDFLGYGAYLYPFLWRLVFGFSFISILFLVYDLIKSRPRKLATGTGITICMIIAVFSGSEYLENHIPQKKKEEQIAERVSYEKKYRKYQHINQPIIKKVDTKINLYPNERSYTIQGEYILKNPYMEPIDSILIHVPEDFEIQSLVYQYKNETIRVDEPISELYLNQPLQSNDSAKLSFELSYKWHPINSHDPFNAIVEEGSFMRISRYFPQFGYDEGKELADIRLRKKHGLGTSTELQKLGAPKDVIVDAIELNMQISTPKNQIAVGTGELQRQWQIDGRNFYEYAAASIPFRFAVSSATYQTKSVKHNNIDITVYHHPLHKNNVDHLIENTKLTLDYCIENFGPYPFTSINYSEVSSFTQGFAGTAYPGTIFMTENMTFNANLGAGDNQDVVNELAGHEVAHFWWGTNQIVPDYREGYSMLTESLAMYTEMMIYKKMYGKEKMMERVAIHQQIYDAEKGLHEKKSLLKVAPGETYLAYSKGAIVFVELSELIGENQLNKALRSFLEKNRYPGAKPISTDLLEEILEMSDNSHHEKIKSLFE